MVTAPTWPHPPGCQEDKLLLRYLFSHLKYFEELARYSYQLLNMILSLPPEIVILLLEHVPPSDLCTLRLVSKAFVQLVNPRLFSKFIIDVPKRGLQKWTYISNLISDSVATFSTSVQEITILDLNPTPEGENDDDEELVLAGRESVTAQPLLLFAECVSKLQNVKAVV
jgi:hypothetical protein